MNIINAKELINFKRLDLIVKYLYAKEFLEKDENAYNNDIYKDLYIRHILMRTMGVEPERDYEKTSKFSADDFCNSFEKLILKIKNNGYDSAYPIHINKDKLPENGAHRIAISALMNLQIPYIECDSGCVWDFNWFSKNGFNTEDKQRILKGFVDINLDNCAIFVVWNPLFKHLDNVKAIMNSYFDIVGEVDLDFENNYIAFTNALLEIYEPNISKSGNDIVIREKSKLLQASYLSFKVIVVTNQNKNNDKEIGELSKLCKNDIRDLFNHFLPKECFCTVHSSDCKDECQYLASILLSPNNIKHLKMRVDTIVDSNFINKIRNLPSFLETIGILNKNDICVIGSGVMNALGIQKSSDIDFIIDTKYRNKFGWESVHLNEIYDIGISDKLAKRMTNLSDNILIGNDEYHFWFKGIKFANLEIIKDRKRHSLRAKDIEHLRQIDLFEKMTCSKNQQKILINRIQEEKERRLNFQKSISNYKVVYSNIFERILSFKNEISNNKKYKVITILGTKFKIRCTSGGGQKSLSPSWVLPCLNYGGVL